LIRLAEARFSLRRSRIGRFNVQKHADGMWHIDWYGEGLGAYANPELAVADLIGGGARLPSNGVRPSSLGLPSEIGGWHIYSSSVPPRG
jgi:hypothetical protein